MQAYDGGMLATMAIDVSTILNDYDTRYYLYRMTGTVDALTGLYDKETETITPFTCHDQPATGDEIQVLPEGLRDDEIRKIYTSTHIDVLKTSQDFTVQAQLVSNSNVRGDTSASWWRLYDVKRYGFDRHYKALMVPITRPDVDKTLGYV